MDSSFFEGPLRCPWLGLEIRAPENKFKIYFLFSSEYSENLERSQLKTILITVRGMSMAKSEMR